MNRTQLVAIIITLLCIPGFIVGGFVLGWPLLAGGILMYILFGKNKITTAKPVEEVEEEVEEVESK